MKNKHKEEVHKLKKLGFIQDSDDEDYTFFYNKHDHDERLGFRKEEGEWFLDDISSTQRSYTRRLDNATFAQVIKYIKTYSANGPDKKPQQPSDIPTVTIEIPRYFVAKVNDYHEFDSIKSNLKMATKTNYKYQEIDNTGYHAVFWIGKKPSEFIKKYQAENL